MRGSFDYEGGSKCLIMSSVVAIAMRPLLRRFAHRARKIALWNRRNLLPSADAACDAPTNAAKG
jgi:hypothetical protein